MINKRLWIALLAIPICVISVFLVGAQRGRQAVAGGVIDPTCTSSLPCIEYDNNGSGPGIRGVSIGGNGLAGATKFNSTSLVNSREGLIGNDISTSGSFNAGVRGLSVRGFGVAGQSTSGSGVSGISTSGSGVTATSTSGEGLNAISTNLDGVVGRTLNPSKTSGFGVAGVDGLDNSSDGGHLNSGLLGTSTNGIGVSAVSSNYVGAAVTGGVGNFLANPLPALSIVGNPGANDLIDACPSGTVNPCDRPHSVLSVNSAGELAATAPIFVQEVVAQGKGSDLYQGYSSGTALVFRVTDGGDVHAHSFTSDLAATRIQPTATGRSVRTYSQQSSQPSLEDFGEAQLTNGQAYVHLSPDFANVVDQLANYLVFITPEGDANVLYVTQKSPGGFAVRESHGGRSTLMFSYRIVAKPFGSHEARLPMVELPKLHSGLPTQARRFHPQF